MKTAVLPFLLVLFALSAFAEKIAPVTGTYKDALRKAGQAGKPLLLEFYRDDRIDCKRLEAMFEAIPDTMAKFTYYRVNGDARPELVQQFQVFYYPTVLFLKPDGAEIHRQRGIHTTVEGQKNFLGQVLDKAGPIAVAQKPRKMPEAQRPALEAAASNELKTATSYLSLGRTNQAVRALKQLLTKYPETEAAEKAREWLEENEK